MTTAAPDPDELAIVALRPITSHSSRILRSCGAVTCRELIDGDRLANGRYLYDKSSMNGLKEINRRLKDVFGVPLHDDHRGGN